MAKLIFAVVLFANLAAAQMPMPALPASYVDTTYNLPASGQTWKVHTSADLKAALSGALPGDNIVLDAGVTYGGNFTLPARSNPDQKWIYIISSAMASLPAPGNRVSPTRDAANMPKIVTSNTTAALTAVAGANHYRLAGLEIYSSSTQGCRNSGANATNCFSYQLLYAQSVPGKPLVDSITVDRCYLHGSPKQDVREGILANAGNFALVDSYIADIHQSTFDSQAVLAYYSPGPIKIVNNFLSATTEEVMFGGAGGKTNPWVPSDIEIRGNHFFKPAEWAKPGVTLPPRNQWVVKNNLEFKSARRVLVDGNVMENSWVSGQIGYSVLFTVRTGQSGDLAVVDDITFTNNVMKNVANGFDTLSADYNCGSTSSPDCANKGESRRVLIKNNLILFRDPSAPGGIRNMGIWLAPGISDWVLQHNTFVPAAGTDCWNSIYFGVTSSTKWPPTKSTTTNVWLLDNALCRQPTGDWSGQGTKGLAYYMGDPAPVTSRFVGNVMYVPANNKVQLWPVHNYATTVPLVYENPLAEDYQLAKPYWTDTSDAHLSGVVDGPSLPISF